MDDGLQEIMRQLENEEVHHRAPEFMLAISALQSEVAERRWYYDYIKEKRFEREEIDWAEARRRMADGNGEQHHLRGRDNLDRSSVELHPGAQPGDDLGKDNTEV